MSMYAEGLHERLRDIWDVFNVHCRQHGVSFSIVSDESDLQGYLIGKNSKIDIPNLTSYIEHTCEQNNKIAKVQTDESCTVVIF